MAAPVMKICVPGQRLCPFDDDHVVGYGTYNQNGYIHAALAGTVQMTSVNEQIHVSVKRNENKNTVPTPGTIVTVQITHVNPRFCKCSILSMDDCVLTHPFRGMIRKEDVRATEKDRVELYKCFRPGDIVIARVLSLGDSQSYLLSTAENELGVVMATSEAGVAMVPVSWCHMQCPKTLFKEERKVAAVKKIADG